MPTVAEIVKDWLVEHGYTGLCGEECGCQIDDLMPCGEMMSECEAGMALHRTCGCEKCPVKEHCECSGEYQEGEDCQVTERRDPEPHEIPKRP